MKYTTISLPDTGAATVRIARFTPPLDRRASDPPQGAGSPASEWHIMITLNDTRLAFEEQLHAVTTALDRVVASEMPATARPMLKRWFLSDAANQARLIPPDGGDCCQSVIEQPPLDGSKAVLWVWMADGMACKKEGAWSHNGYTHRFTSALSTPGADPETATRALLGNLSDDLKKQGGSLAGNCVRTWFFVNDIDNNYQGVVAGRNRVFDTEGLTAATHFIASTGIGGRTNQAASLVAMDAYSLTGIRPGQMRWLYARTHMCPTSDYGVAFERGSSIDYGDRRHVLVSGTASIDDKGEILHRGDVVKQAGRMLDNVGALLDEAGCSWDDVGHMIVYLRDIADHARIARILDDRFPAIPRVIVQGRVCRPGWLIEMECMAARSVDNPSFSPF